jgi:ATP-dependent Lon protease
MEVLDLPGYAEEEKLHIARSFMIPRQASDHGLEAGRDIVFTDDGVLEIVRGHTHESGVRNLERAIGAICRKHARRIAEEDRSLLVVGPGAVQRHLGIPKFRIETELDERTRKPGVSVALAWTPHGGDVLFIEATRMPRDKGDVTLTGQLGQVMQESAKAALSWLRANGRAHGIEPEEFRNFDLHLHVPAGAVPKDGPSAGIALVAAVYSLFVNRPIRPRVAMTGEITLSGQVLAVGGIKEKVLAARRSGVREVLLPDRNEAELLEDVPAHLREGISFRRVRTIEDVLECAFAAEDGSPGA